MGNSWLVRQLRKWSSIFDPDIIFLSETMVNKQVAEAIKDCIGHRNAFGVASRGKAGGLCILWREDVSFSLVSYSNHHICGDVGEGDKKWRFVGVYGWAKEEEKYRSWNLIRYLCEESSLPMRRILSYEEKEGGDDRVRREMAAFRDTVDDLSLHDLGY